jgi:RHS repeat-associated protein
MSEPRTRTKYTYDSFGKLTASTGSLTNPFQYTARESDPETGLYYYRARYYDPYVGRFTSEDPLGFAGGINKYDYVNGNPTNWIDNYGTTCGCPDPQQFDDEIDQAEDEMVQNLFLPLKRAGLGGINGGIIGCLVASEVGCVEGLVPGAIVGALGGLIEGGGEALYDNTVLLLKIRKLIKNRAAPCSK